MGRSADPTVNYCYEKAREIRGRAFLAQNSVDRELRLNIAAQWLALGATHEYASDISAFLAANTARTRDVSDISP